MLNFVVFEYASDGTARAHPAWGLKHAYVFGADDVPVQAEVRTEAGYIRCETRTKDSAGLALQFPVDAPETSGLSGELAERVKRLRGDGAGGGGGNGSVGVVTLQTCLLPSREKPYLLSLELARHRLMAFFNKLEDWALFDLQGDHPALALFERARRAFTLALVEAAKKDASEKGCGGFSPASDRLARSALSLAVEASELLTLEQARTQFAKRASGELAAAAAKAVTPLNAITDHEAAHSRNLLIGNVGVILPTPVQVGVMVNPNAFTPALTKAAQGCCDFLCMPMRWVDMEPTEGKYLFSNTDRWIEWAVRTARVPVVGGPIIELRRGCVPEWMYIWEHDYETLRELVYEHTRNIVTRYRRTVGTWTVCSGLHVASNFALSFEQMMDLTRLVVMVVRKLQPSAKIQVQIDQPWGEYVGASSRSIPPLVYADMVLQAGVNPDLFALRIETGQPEPGQSTRDLLALSAMLDRYASFDRPLSIATVSAPSKTAAAESLGLDEELEPGYYRAPWSPSSQALWMTRALGVMAAKPYVHSVCWHELFDAAPPLVPAPGGKAADNRFDGLLDHEGNAKPALGRLGAIRAAVKSKQSPLTLES